MKRCILLTLAAAILTVAAGTLPAQTAEADIFGIELGQVTGYDFENEDLVTSELLGLHFGMTDDMEIGVVFLSGDMPGGTMPMFSLLRMTYFLQEEFGFQLSTGSSDVPGTAGGIGVFTAPIRREFDDTLTTSLRLSLDYLNPNIAGVSLTEGILGFGISGKISF